MSAPAFVDLDVPGYGGALVGRYRPVRSNASKRRRVMAISRRGRGLQDATTALAAEYLIEAVDSMWTRVDGRLESLAPEDPNPVRYDQRLAELLGFEATEPREVIAGVFTLGGRLNATALVSHATRASELLTAA